MFIGGRRLIDFTLLEIWEETEEDGDRVLRQGLYVEDVFVDNVEIAVVS